MFWTNFGGAEDAEFRNATAHLFQKTGQSPSNPSGEKLPFALDKEARLEDLATAGFKNLESQTWTWTTQLKTQALIQLYKTYSTIQTLPPQEREQLLNEVTQIAERDFRGLIDQPYSVALYTAQRP